MKNRKIRINVKAIIVSVVLIYVMACFCNIVTNNTQPGQAKNIGNWNVVAVMIKELM